MTWKLQCGLLSHTVSPSVHSSLLARAHCQESVVWPKASGFCYTTDKRVALTGAPLGYPVMELLLFWICRFIPFTWSSSPQMGWMLVWANSKAWFWAWEVAGLLSCQLSLILTTQASSPALPWPNVTWGKDQAHSPALRSLDPDHPHSCHQGHLYCLAQVRCRAFRGHMREVGRVSSPACMPLGRPHLNPDSRVSFSMLLRGAEPALLCAAAREGQG